MNNSKSIWTPLYIQLMAFELCCQFGTYVVNPIVSNYAVFLGATVAVGGFMNGLNPMASLIFRPFGGLFLKRFNRQFLLFIAALVFFISVVVCAVAPSLGTLAVSRVVMGVAFVIKSALVVSLTSDITPRESIGQAVGWIGLACILASALGPSIGSAVGHAVGYQMTFVLAGVLFLIAIVLIKTLKVPQPENEQTKDEAVKAAAEQPKEKFDIKKLFHLKTVPLTGLCFFEAVLFGSITGLLLLVGEMRNIEGISQFFLVYAVVAILARPFSSKMYDKYGLCKVFYPEAVLMLLSPLLLIYAYDMTLVYPAAVCLALGQGCVYPAMQAESVKYVAQEDTAIAVNTFYIGPDAGMAVGPMISGLIIDLAGIEAMFMFDVGVCVVFIVVYGFFYRWQKKMLARSTRSNGTNPII